MRDRAWKTRRHRSGVWLLEDSVTRSGATLGAATETKQVYTEDQGDWSTDGDEATCSSAGTYGVATVDLGISDIEIVVLVTGLGTGYAGGSFRVTDAANHLNLIVNSTSFVVQKLVAGSPTNLIIVNEAIVLPTELRVRAVGPSITAWRNGLFVGTVSDGHNVSATKHGWGGWSMTAGDERADHLRIRKAA